MAWTAANPVSVGDPTKKDHFDAAWDNASYLKDARDDTDEDSSAAFTADDTYDINIAGNDALKLTATAITAKIGATTQMALSQYGMTLKTSRCRAYLATTDQTIGSGAWTKVQLNAESFDELSEFDSTTNYRFTASEAGYYLIYGQAKFLAMADQDVIEIKLRKNASTDLAVASRPTSNDGSLADTINVADIVSLSATDYMELYVQHDNGGNKDIDAGTDLTFMFVHRLS